MRSSIPGRFRCLPLLAAALMGCSGVDNGPTEPTPARPINPIPDGLWRPTPPVAGNWMLILSESGDWLGQGKKWVIVPPFFPWTGGGPGVVMAGAAWSAIFTPMQSLTRLEKGYYPHAGRFASKSHGGLEWSGDGRGCNAISGWFAVDSVLYVGDTIVALDVRSEQHCDGGTVPMYGAVHWRQ